MKRLAIILALVASPAAAQQFTTYGPDGRVIGRAVTDSGGQTTYYGPDGRVLSRSVTQGGQTVIYDRDGRVVSRIVGPRR